jgi:hypothetical protein
VCDLEDIGDPSIFRLILSDPVSGRMLSTLRLELVIERRTVKTKHVVVCFGR